MEDDGDIDGGGDGSDGSNDGRGSVDDGGGNNSGYGVSVDGSSGNDDNSDDSSCNCGGGEGDLLVDDAGVILMGFGVGVRLSLSLVSLIWLAFIRAILAALTRRSKSVMMIFLVLSMFE